MDDCRRGEADPGTGIPTNTFILTRDSATQVTLSANATITNTGVTLSFGRDRDHADQVRAGQYHQPRIGAQRIGAGSGRGGGDPHLQRDRHGHAGDANDRDRGDRRTICAWAPGGSNWLAVPKVAITARNAAAALLVGGYHFTGSLVSNTKLTTIAAPADSTVYIFDVIAVS